MSIVQVIQCDYYVSVELESFHDYSERISSLSQNFDVSIRLECFPHSLRITVRHFLPVSIDCLSISSICHQKIIPALTAPSASSCEVEISEAGRIIPSPSCSIDQFWGDWSGERRRGKFPGNDDLHIEGRQSISDKEAKKWLISQENARS